MFRSVELRVESFSMAGLCAILRCGRPQAPAIPSATSNRMAPLSWKRPTPPREAVTAGGYRLPDTHFIQRYIPSADGKHLKIVFEFNDPRIYVKPHSFEYTFDRMAAGSYALEEFCDATDPLEGQSIVPPEQR